MALSRPIPTRLSRRLCLGAVAVLVIVTLAATPFAYDAYYQNRLAVNAHRPAIEVLRSEALPGARVVVGGDGASGAQGVFDDTYAFLQQQFDLISVQTDSWYPDWELRLEHAVRGHGQTWLYAPPDSPLHAWLDERYTPIAAYDWDGWRLSGWDTR